MESIFSLQFFAKVFADLNKLNIFRSANFNDYLTFFINGKLFRILIKNIVNCIKYTYLYLLMYTRLFTTQFFF